MWLHVMTQQPRIIGGHHEYCDVFELAPDGGPSRKPCNCRKALELAEKCTGVAASWCPIHGDCGCERWDDGERKEDSADCQLHGPESDHAEGADA